MIQQLIILGDYIRWRNNRTVDVTRHIMTLHIEIEKRSSIENTANSQKRIGSPNFTIDRHVTIYTIDHAKSGLQRDLATDSREA